MLLRHLVTGPLTSVPAVTLHVTIPTGEVKNLDSAEFEFWLAVLTTRPPVYARIIAIILGNPMGGLFNPVFCNWSDHPHLSPDFIKELQKEGKGDAYRQYIARQAALFNLMRKG